MNFDGIWTPLVTPFDATGNVDERALTPLVNGLVEHGVNGLIVGGTTGANGLAFNPGHPLNLAMARASLQQCQYRRL